MVVGRDAVVALLEACRSMRQLKQLHAHMVTTALSRDVVPLSRLLDFCTDPAAGDLDYGRSVFLRVECPSVYIWNSIIRGFSCSERPEDALRLYRDMQRRGYRPDHFTFPFVFRSCAAVSNRPLGRCVHSRVVRTGYESDLYVSSSLIHAYVGCGDVESAEALFEKASQRNVVAWTTMIAGYVNVDRPGDAVRLFKEMFVAGVQANEVTMVNVLAACAQSRDLDTGRWVHRQLHRIGSCDLIQSNVILGTAIIDMYARCGSLVTARELFDRMTQRNKTSWNAMISAYNQYERPDKVAELYSDMRKSGLQPDKVTLLGLLGACAQRGDWRRGQGVHAHIEKANGGHDIALQTTLLDMYSKTGDTQSALRLFSRLERRDVVAWTSMVIGLAMHGHGQEALNVFQAMQEDGVAPDGVAFIGVLSACRHSGLVEEGRRYFDEMRSVRSIIPTLQHYCCMVDLLSRAGRLSEAESFVGSMPVRPSMAVWGAMLSGCRIYGDMEVAERLENKIVELNPASSGVYILLSNVYAGGGRWGGVGWARASIWNNKVEKTVGYSRIEA
ncbi:hypothetical protein Taro_015685 [Colocasia esculenta]|uniref:Pentatricopeptide repeat-containing protein n=1 Tax=Colocasia esculenta TaxID=4460 RepID=A0A843UMX2_COLES|nr:hypothetical protein [Colocasia esculenta]